MHDYSYFDTILDPPFVKQGPDSYQYKIKN